MAGYTFEQLQKMGAKVVTPTKPVGFTLEELQAKQSNAPKTTLMEENNPSYWGSFVGKGRLKQNVEDSAKMRADKIKESMASSDSGLKKTVDIGAQVVAGALFDPVGNIISSIIPKWVKDRFAGGVDKVNENVQNAMIDSGLTKPTPIGQQPEKQPSILESIASPLSKKVDEPTQYMLESQKQMFDQAQQIRNKAFAETNPEKKKILEETARGMETAVQEINKSITDTQARQKSLTRSAESTVILGNVALMGTPKTVSTAPQQAGKIIDLTKDDASGLWKSINQSSPEQLEQQLTNFYAKAVKPSVAGKMTIPQANQAIGNQVIAISLINKAKPSLKFMDNGVEIVGRAPESMQELAEAVSQTKKGIFEQYNSLATASNEMGGKVQLSSIADELDKIANNVALRDTEPAIIKYVEQMANTYRARGEYDILTTQDVIKVFNDKLNAYYRAPNPEYTSKVAVDAMIVNKLRELADAVIENTKGAGYAGLKRQYGALKSIEKEVVHRAIIEARKNTKGLMDFTDIASGAQLASWILTGNLAALGQAGAIKAISAYYKYLNSVDTNVRKMFEVAEKLQRVKKDGLVPPRAGLSIYDVTKYGQKNLPQTNKPTQISIQTKKTAPAKTGATAQSTKNTNISNKLGIPNATTKQLTKSIDDNIAANIEELIGVADKSFMKGKVDINDLALLEKIKEDVVKGNLTHEQRLSFNEIARRLNREDMIHPIPKPSPESTLLQEAKNTPDIRRLKQSYQDGVTLYRGEGGGGGLKAREDIGNALGEGKYYTDSYSQASRYGKNIKEVTVKLKKPLIIETDQDLRNITGGSNLVVSSKVGVTPAMVKQQIAETRQAIIDAGYDGVIVKMKTFDTSQNLRRLFEHDQTIVYSKK